MDDYLNEEQYLKALKGVIRKQARNGSTVFNGHGSHLFIPSETPALHILVTVSKQLRIQRAEVQQGLSRRSARKWLKRADSTEVSKFKYLLGCNLLDQSQYDLVLNMDELTYEKAAQLAIMHSGFSKPLYQIT